MKTTRDLNITLKQWDEWWNDKSNHGLPDHLAYMSVMGRKIIGITPVESKYSNAVKTYRVYLSGAGDVLLDEHQLIKVSFEVYDDQES